MGIHLYFNLIKLIYSYTGRKDKKYVLFEMAGSLLVIALSIWGLQPISRALAIWFRLDITEKNLIISFILGVLFILTSFISRLANKKNPVEVTTAPKNHKVIPIGIIDCVWLIVMGVSYSLTLIASSFPETHLQLTSGLSIEYYQMYFDECEFLLGKLIDLVIILGSILAACMTIIWSGEIWKKGDPESRNEYSTTTIASIQMVLGYFLTVGGVFIWVAYPLFKSYSTIKDYFH